MTKHSDQYIFSGYSIGFDRKGKFSFGNVFGRNVIIFGVDMISSEYVDNKKKDILILGEDPTQGLDGTTLTARKRIQIFSLEKIRNFCLSLHYNGAKSYLFLNNTEIHKLKARDSETVAIPLCLWNISKVFPVDNMKKTESNGYVYDFSLDYDAITVDDILDMHKYLTKKNNMI